MRTDPDTRERGRRSGLTGEDSRCLWGDADKAGLRRGDVPYIDETGAISVDALWGLGRRFRNCAPLVRAMSLLPLGGGTILRYHSVNDEPGWAGDYVQRSLVVPTDVFDRQVASLVKSHRVVGVPELAAAIASGRRVDPRTVAITFDDGYEDNYRCAFPILKKHGATATFYVTTGAISDASILWTVALRHAIRRTEAPGLECGTFGACSVDLSTPRAKEKAIAFITAVVKRCGEGDALDIVSEVQEACGNSQAAYDARIMMNPDEIREMHEGGMTIGAHSVTHYNLPSLAIDALVREVGESKRALEELLGCEVEHFAYPNGRTNRHFDARTAAVVAEAGFRSAVTSIAGPASRRYPAHCLPRLGIVPHDADVRWLAADIQYARLSRPNHASLREVAASSGSRRAPGDRRGAGAMDEGQEAAS